MSLSFAMLRLETYRAYLDLEAVVTRLNDDHPRQPITLKLVSFSADGDGEPYLEAPAYAEAIASPGRMQHLQDELNARMQLRRRLEAMLTSPAEASAPSLPVPTEESPEDPMERALRESFLDPS